MNQKIKICLCAVFCGGSALLMLLHPLWLAGVLAGLFLLLRTGFSTITASETDPLTGLWNLRRLEHQRSWYQKADRLAVLYLDLDDLKQINDSQGHTIGNAAIQQVAHALLDADDEAYRMGGDEFLLVSTEMDASELESCWIDASESLSVRVSWGTASGAGFRLDELIAQAEQNMYQRK